METGFVFDAVKQAIEVTLLVATPLLATALVVGVLVSLVQAVTQIQEQTLTFVPKLAAVALVLFAFVPWFLAQLTDFLVESLQRIPGVVW